MARTYDLDEAGLVVEGENCPDCNSSNTRYDNGFGFWKCEDCSTVWGHDKDDPDYDEPDICPECQREASGILNFPEWRRCDGCGYEWRIDDEIVEG